MRSLLGAMKRSNAGAGATTTNLAPEDAPVAGAATATLPPLEPTKLAGADRGQPAAQPADQAPSQGKPCASECPQLDLAFVCDCTGSMGEYIAAAQQNIRSIVERVVQSEKAEVRFALVAYRDHPPEDETYVTWVHPFTSDVEAMRGYVGTMSADGGGDGPEAVTAALHDALHLPWRASATKIAVLIADAPPHGLEPFGDGFPNGDPLGRDPLAIAREMAAQEIVCYTVGCEPALGAYRFARDFMCTLAEITGGQAVALASAALLAEVIINGSAEEIALTQLQREVELELEHVRHLAEEAGEQLNEEVVWERAAGNLHSRNVRCKQMQTDGAMKNAHYSVWHKSGMQTLAAAKAELSALDPIEQHAWERLDAGRSRGPRAKASRKGAGGAFRAAAATFRGLLRYGAAAEREELAERAPAAELELFDGSDEFDERALSGRVERCEAPVAAPAVMSKSVLSEDLISVEQISRVAKRSAHRRGGM
mmetsp:Transcript_120752/g.336950  ORF Transcript_120752/g.336950 Transcript_120752/m.336950 type:complete len:482 (-) Transcript_120752:113-1558(-)